MIILINRSEGQYDDYQEWTERVYDIPIKDYIAEVHLPYLKELCRKYEDAGFTDYFVEDDVKGYYRIARNKKKNIKGETKFQRKLNKDFTIEKFILNKFQCDPLKFIVEDSQC